MPEPDLPPAALAWVHRASPAGSNPTVIRTLPGGQHADTVLLGTDSGYGEFVLRLLPTGDEAVADHEVRTLDLLDGLDGLTPRLVAADPSGSLAGRPALLITRLPGGPELIRLAPDEVGAELGKALARIHAVGVHAAMERGVWNERGDRMAFETRRLDSLSEPYASSLTAAWPRLSSEPRVLAHNDFWAGNAVWQSGRLAGVVDWSGAALAPRGFDVGWCRLDLFLLYETREAPDAFLDAYESAAGISLSDTAWWDMHAAARSIGQVETWSPNYAGLRRADLVPEELGRRHHVWLEQGYGIVAGPRR